MILSFAQSHPKIIIKIDCRIRDEQLITRQLPPNVQGRTVEQEEREFWERIENQQEAAKKLSFVTKKPDTRKRRCVVS